MVRWKITMYIFTLRRLHHLCRVVNIKGHSYRLKEYGFSKSKIGYLSASKSQTNEATN